MVDGRGRYTDSVDPKLGFTASRPTVNRRATACQARFSGLKEPSLDGLIILAREFIRGLTDVDAKFGSTETVLQIIWEAFRSLVTTVGLRGEGLRRPELRGACGPSDNARPAG